ncbi:MAG: hypothetical protein J6Q83_00010 [Clostridia bacterium]|nr:hypothetical protein [Clostridia bacterium]
MIGLGKYKADINNMFFKGEAIFELKDNNGKYEIEIELEDKDIEMPDINIVDAEEDGNTLTAKATSPEFPGKAVDVSLTFEDEKCNGFLKIPFVGKVKIKDAVKIG